MTSAIDYRTRPKDLSAQKQILQSPNCFFQDLKAKLRAVSHPVNSWTSALLGGIVLIVIWAISTFMFSGPGWVDLPHPRRDSSDLARRRPRNEELTSDAKGLKLVT